MSAPKYQQKNMTGSMKETSSDNPKYPHIKGTCTINGIGYWVSAWWKEFDGQRKLSLSFQTIEQPKIAQEDVPARTSQIPPCTDPTLAGSVDPNADSIPY